MADKFILGIDLGGTKIIISVAKLTSSNNCFHEIASLRLPTDAHLGGEVVLKRLVSETHALLKGQNIALEQVEAITLGTPGIVHPENLTTSHSENIPGWDQLPVYPHLQKSFPYSKVCLENDVNLAALAELYEGSGRNHNSFLLIAVGTGLGCGVIIDRALYKGLGGSAGEIGVMWVPNGESFSEPSGKENFEAMVSGASLSRKLGDGSGVEQAFRQYQKREEPGYAIIAKWLLTLQIGILNAVSVLAPEAVILAGGVISSNPWVCSPVQDFLRRWAYSPPVVKMAQLGDKAAVRGALYMSLRASANR